MEINGRIKMLGEAKQVSPSFRKRELVVTTEEQYPQHIMVEFVQDKTDLLNGYGEGDLVKVSINLRGREWTSPQGEVKYFNTIQGWRIERVGVSQSQSASTPSASSMPSMPSMPPAADDFDDLPF